ncbi:MAG: FAD-dependent oxidoreductase [Planctomycetes bacterium]|nr:FAD-dependent oxidoreductase [Planctomycetota bacterium]
MPRSLFAILNDRFDPEARFTRREAIQASLASAAGLLLSSCAADPEKTRHKAGPRVCVIGAGFAGLACGYEMASADWDVTVVEAKNRVGGRVLSRRDLVPGKNVEAGGERIGSNHPLWIAYAKKFSLTLFEATPEPGTAPVMFDGKRLNATEQESLWHEFREALPAINAQAEPVDADSPWLSPGAAELDARTAAEAIETLEAGEWAKRELRRQLVADHGVALERQSWLANLAQVKGGGLAKFWTESDALRCAGGNQQLALRLADAIGLGRVRLGVPAVRVETRENGVIVKLEDLTKIEADWVVVAVPPSVWSRIVFEPALPTDLRPQMGSAVVFLAALDAPFWRGTGDSAEARTDGAISETWNGTTGQERGEGACLTAFSGGPAAEACRAFGREGRVGRYGEELGRLWPGYAEHFRKSLFMDWPSDPWVGAGTSFPAPGEVMALGSRLREGFGRIQIAGEHGSAGFVGTMEGALQSGVGVARKIVAAGPSPR